MIEMSTRPAILFVDDEARIGRLLKMMFRADYEVFVAEHAVAAFRVLETQPVDVVVSDQRMPGITGVQFLSLVRARWPETVRLLLTGYSDLVAIIGAVNEGEVNRFLSKPWNLAELREVIAEAVDLAESLRVTRESVGQIWQGGMADRPFSVASQLLVIDGYAEDRQQVNEMFAPDYQCRAVATVTEATRILGLDDIGVIALDTGALDTGALDLDAVGFLAAVADVDPAITVVAMTAFPHGESVIRLINSGRIFRFAMKPFNRNLFRLAVNSAMREHHRRLADPRIVARRLRRRNSGPSRFSDLA